MGTQARCVVCMRELSMKPDTRDRRYFDKDLNGWAHVACDPSGKSSIDLWFDNVLLHSRTREDAATLDMAADNGHSVTIERQPTTHLGRPSLLKRAVCSCGYGSPWSLHRSVVVAAKRDHLKDAAIYG